MPFQAGEGPKQKLTQEVADAIIESIEAGSFASVAARAAGVSRASFWRWVREGRKPGAPAAWRKFAERYDTAAAMAETDAVKVVRNSMVDGEWQAAAWYLERRSPKRWGKAQDQNLLVRHAVVDDKTTPQKARELMAEMLGQMATAAASVTGPLLDAEDHADDGPAAER